MVQQTEQRGSLRCLMGLVLLTLGLHTSAQGATESRVVQRDLGADHFAAGRNVAVIAPVTGDALLTGRIVDVLADIGGDLVAAGGDIHVNKPVKQDVYAAGGRVSIHAPVGHNVRAAGGTVELGPEARVTGNTSLGGGELRVLGPIDGYLQVAGRHVLIDATVAGDVDAAGQQIDLGPNARIGGKLRYMSHNELKREAGAAVAGGIERLEPEGSWQHANHHRGFGRAASWAWSVGITVLSAVLMGVLPGFAGRIGDTVRSRWGWSLLVGFIGLVCIPVLVVILLLSILGIPLALVLMAVYILLLLVGYASIGVATGEIALGRIARGRTLGFAWRIVAAAVAMAVVTLLGRVPVLGGFVVLAAILIGIGALLLQLFRAPATRAA